jgi:hypothetical protein
MLVTTLHEELENQGLECELRLHFGTGDLLLVALDGLLDKVADNYKKLTVADRKALRAVINWLRGNASSDDETKQSLVALLSGQAAVAPAVPTIEPDAPLGPNDLKLKKLR